MKDGQRYCVVMPTYENAGTVCRVVDSVIEAGYHLIAVSDGPHDGTLELLERYGDRITLVAYPVNKGKGHALSAGFAKAVEGGYDYAVTIDSDGQHSADDIAVLIEKSLCNPVAVIVGKRMMEGVERPASSGFANAFANFWFSVHTLRRFPDTQSGFRCYPLSYYGRMKPVTSRYEAELEMLVRGAWHGLNIIAVPVKVYYPPEKERVSHFRKGRDFMRISLLNTVLTFAALFYGYPSMLVHKTGKARIHCPENCSIGRSGGAKAGKKERRRQAV